MKTKMIGEILVIGFILVLAVVMTALVYFAINGPIADVSPVWPLAGQLHG